MRLTTDSLYYFNVGDVVKLRLHKKRYFIVALIAKIDDTFLVCNCNNFYFKIDKNSMDGRYEIRLIGHYKAVSP